MTPATPATLPSLAIFPQIGTPAFNKWNDDAREGKIDFGPHADGGHLIWDFNKTPHGLIGGKTGMGKSVALNSVVFAALYNPDFFELVVCDPQISELAWTREFPNVVRYAVNDTYIADAAAYAINEMNRRQSLLAKVGVRNVRELRQKFADNPDLVKEHGKAPKRLILVLDELSDFFVADADADTKKLQDKTRTDLEKIARLGRALEVNLVFSAQKPEFLDIQLRSQLGFRLAVGPTDLEQSDLLLNSDHGTRHPATGSPKGRAWGYDPLDEYQLCQVYYLSYLTGPVNWSSQQNVTGIQDLVRTHLSNLGYVSLTITNSNGGTERRWA